MRLGAKYEIATLWLRSGQVCFAPCNDKRNTKRFCGFYWNFWRKNVGLTWKTQDEGLVARGVGD